MIVIDRPQISGIILALLILGCRYPSSSVTETPKSLSPDQISADILARHNRAVGLMGQFQYAQAAEQLEQIVREEPSRVDLKIDLAIATLNRRQPGDSQQAIQLLQEASTQDPENLRAAYCQGILYLDQGNPIRALEMFRQVASLDPQDAYAAYYTGQSLSQMNRLEPALEYFERALQIDPYLRSAYYGAFQTALRLGQTGAAMRYQQQFQRLEGNPQARLAEIKYTRMGPKAEVKPLEQAVDARNSRRPEGPLFSNTPETLWERPTDQATPEGSPHIASVDVDGDGTLEIVLTNATGMQSTGMQSENLLLQRSEDGFQPIDWPLRQIAGVRGSAWGDYDNDGHVDVYLYRQGRNQLWKQSEQGQWQDVTEETNTGGEAVNTNDAIWLDADHDGDLDLFVANDGPDELFSNNLDGTFRLLGESQQLAGDDRRSLRVIPADIDRDRDLDLLIFHDQPPHRFYENQLLWDYSSLESLEALRQQPIELVAAADTDADGRVEIFTLSQGLLERWAKSSGPQWQRESITTLPAETSNFSILDIDGDADQEILAESAGRLLIFNVQPAASLQHALTDLGQVTAWQLVNLDPASGPSLLAINQQGQLRNWNAGPGRYPFLATRFSGKEDRGEQMRSNRSGIGVTGAARFGTHWSSINTLPTDSQPGQSLQPLALGTAGQPTADFVQMTWPDGVFQTELQLEAGKLHEIQETQRQVASCPVVFAWDGERYRFVTDVLGVAGLGFNTGNGQYAEPRDWEALLLPPFTKSRDGLLELKIGEPMEEVCYLDRLKLTCYDLPTGWSMSLDERFAVSGPEPTGKPIFYRQQSTATEATQYTNLPNSNQSGIRSATATSTTDGSSATTGHPQQSVTTTLAKVDQFPVWAGKQDNRFLGRTPDWSIELSFDRPVKQYHNPWLLIDGWIEYPYSQTMFAAWQANAAYLPLSLEVGTEQGGWKSLYEQFGYMAGMPRQCAIPLPKDVFADRPARIRLSSNMEIYIDRIMVVNAESCPEAVMTPVRLTQAHVADVGFAKRATAQFRRPDYDYQQRSPLWDTRHPRGFYTRFGECTPLVADRDNALAIVGPGEELHASFGPVPPRLPHLTRHWVVHFDGWCKDMDLYTRDGETVTPLPKSPEMPASDNRARTQQLHQQYNVRYRAGY